MNPVSPPFLPLARKGGLLCPDQRGQGIPPSLAENPYRKVLIMTFHELRVGFPVDLLGTGPIE